MNCKTNEIAKNQFKIYMILWSIYVKPKLYLRIMIYHVPNTLLYRKIRHYLVSRFFFGKQKMRERLRVLSLILKD